MLLRINCFVIFMLAMALPVSAASLRDPTQPPSGWQVASATTSAEQAHSGLTLNSIISSHDNSRAVINNQIYRVGDKVNGVAIRAISAQQVKLANGNILRLFPAVTAPNKKR